MSSKEMVVLTTDNDRLVFENFETRPVIFS